MHTWHRTLQLERLTYDHQSPSASIERQIIHKSGLLRDVALTSLAAMPNSWLPEQPGWNKPQVVPLFGHHRNRPPLWLVSLLLIHVAIGEFKTSLSNRSRLLTVRHALRDRWCIALTRHNQHRCAVDPHDQKPCVHLAMDGVLRSDLSLP